MQVTDEPVRVLVAAIAVAVALVLQVTVFPHFAWHGIVPNLCCSSSWARR